MSADRKSRFLYQDAESRGSSHGGLANLLRVTQLIHQLFHVALSPITPGGLTVAAPAASTHAFDAEKINYP